MEIGGHGDREDPKARRSADAKEFAITSDESFTGNETLADCETLAGCETLAAEICGFSGEDGGVANKNKDPIIPVGSGSF